MRSKLKTKNETRSNAVFPNKFADIPTRQIRVKAAAFGLEKLLFPESTLRNRINGKFVVEEIFTNRKNKLRNATYSESSLKQKDSVFDERTWRGWLHGDLKRPQLLNSLCRQLSDEDWSGKILELDKTTSPVLLLLHSIDVLAFSAECEPNSATANFKINRAREILKKIEQKWTAKSQFHQIFIPKTWLIHEDIETINKSNNFQHRQKTEREMFEQKDPQNTSTTKESLINLLGSVLGSYSLDFGGCRSLPTTNFDNDRVEFILNKDVCDRFELETPLKFLQYLLRMSLYLESNSEFPIHTYSIDLLTTAIATYIFYNWYDDGISGRITRGPIMEAIDATLKLFCLGGSHTAGHLIYTTAPWGRSEKFSQDKVTENLKKIRHAYMDTLHGHGITQLSIKRLVQEIEFVLLSNKLKRAPIPSDRIPEGGRISLF